MTALQNTEQLSQTLSDLKRQDINCILVDAKNAQGQVLYQSANQTVAEVAAQAAGAVDMDRLRRWQKKTGMTVICKNLRISGSA